VGGETEEGKYGLALMDNRTFIKWKDGKDQAFAFIGDVEQGGKDSALSYMAVVSQRLYRMYWTAASLGRAKTSALPSSAISAQQSRLLYLCSVLPSIS